MPEFIIIALVFVLLTVFMAVVLKLAKYKEKPSGCCGGGGCSTSHHHYHDKATHEHIPIDGPAHTCCKINK